VTAVSVPRIEARIQTVRALRVMVDADLAEIHGVPTKRLNEQVKRNGRRFPADFMFQLTTAEKAEVVANCDHLQKLKFSKALPFAFKRSPLLVPTTGLRAPKPSLGDALPSKEGPLHRSRVPERAARCWPGVQTLQLCLGHACHGASSKSRRIVSKLLYFRVLSTPFREAGCTIRFEPEEF